MGIYNASWLRALRGLSLLIGFAMMPAVAQADANTFSGQGTAVSATVAGINTKLGDTGPLPSSGGALEASLLSAQIDGLSADVLHATTVGQQEESRSEASVADVMLTVAGNTIAADFLMASAEATCNGGGAAVTGSSEVFGLVINGQTIAVSGQPNQTISLPAGTGEVIINEQNGSASGSDGTITVNALHVIANGVADIIISSAHADIHCAGQAPCNGDFITGGGWITSPSGAKGTFGVAGGIKNGSLWGHLTYIDHGSGLKVKGTGVTNYAVTGPTSRQIDGTCEVNGQPGYTYTVNVTDNGEPGTNDFFQLTVPGQYTASGNLGGGNIKLHNCQ
jgi:hypothetical protein